MKKSILASGLALSLLVGGAGLSSGTVGAAPIHEKSINIEQSLKKDEVQPMIWAAVGKAALKGAAWGVGFVVGEKAAEAVLGDNEEKESNYNYEDIIESFDF
ncbi:hypothetical protein P9B03_02570 [Metasolibacillus meyeri]|uniref:Uncharacterized protein n=1 Tax=Metasolibacillus meyeri TaxID=1071052 RepID=A0AAW9NRH4_9BACL|nr:hypothetical protein [Metasolibacillus meyeri]MEC1177356.1 hypothetical protein [Metasolibacillus meyeri]